MRAIDGGAFREKLREWALKQDERDVSYSTVLDVIELIDKEPTIDVVPADSVRGIIEMMRRVVNKYEKSQERVIWEYSGRIHEDEIALHKECRGYRKRIKKLLVESNGTGCVRASNQVNVVFCKDCRKCNVWKDGHSFTCNADEIDYYAPTYDAATYFCADGERRIEDNVPVG